MKKLFVSLLVVCLCMAIAGCRRDQAAAGFVADDVSTHPRVTLRLGSVEPVEDLFNVSAFIFADLVREKSGGTVTVEIFPSQQLGDMPRMFEAVMMGTQDIVGGSGSFKSNFISDLAVETTFFLFDGEEHFLRFWNSDLARNYIEEFTGRTGVIPLSHNWVRGARYFIAQNPLRTLDDFRDVRVRVPDIRGYLRSAEALDMRPAMITWGELYLALLQGIVEAAENAPFALYAARFHEVAPYLMETLHLFDIAVLYMNERSFNRLTPLQQRAVLEATLEAGEIYSQKVRDMTQDIIGRMVAEGATFIPRSEIDIATLSSMVKEGAMMWEQEGVWARGLYERVAAMR